MPSEHYLLNTPTIALMNLSEGDQVAVTILKGAVLKISNGTLDGSRFTDVEWDGKAITMFTADVRERGTLVAEEG